MKTFNIQIEAQIQIHEPEYYNNHSGRVTATMRSPNGNTNYSHHTLIVMNGEDPTERFIEAFGAKVIPAPETASDPKTEGDGTAKLETAKEKKAREKAEKEAAEKAAGDPPKS